VWLLSTYRQPQSVKSSNHDPTKQQDAFGACVGLLVAKCSSRPGGLGDTLPGTPASRSTAPGTGDHVRAAATLPLGGGGGVLPLASIATAAVPWLLARAGTAWLILCVPVWPLFALAVAHELQ
jgi:hypothetical protein